MNKVRELKKDIDRVIADVVFRCFQFIEDNDTVDEAQVLPIAEEALTFQVELRKRACHPDAKDNKAVVKKYYRKITADLINCHQQSIEKLNSLKA